MSQLSGRFEIVNRLGLHARAATALVQLANRYQCEIHIRKGTVEVNAKSIMGVLQLAAARGQFVEIQTDGEDGGEALRSLEKLIADRFGEDE